jgi:hypothetical protein
VPGGGGATGSVEVIGDLLVSPAGKEALKDFSDHRRLLWIRSKTRLGVARAGTTGLWMGLTFESIAIRRSPAISVALAGVLRLTTSDLAAELLDLELIQGLEEVADESSLGARLIARAQGVEDINARSSQLSLVCEGVEQVPAQARRRVDNYRVETARFGLLRLADQFAPAHPVVAASPVLIGELADDSAVELRDLFGAFLAL